MISIVIPVYNAELSISRTINSVLLQSYRNWELLLINDGSQDNSEIICTSYVKKDKRVRLISQNNQGVSMARNIGIDNAQGRFIVFIDADDEVKPNYLQELLDDYTNSGKPDLLIQQYLKENRYSQYSLSNLFVHSRSYQLSENCDFFYDLNILSCGYPFSKLFLREKIISNGIKFDKQLTFCEDLVFLLEYLALCESIYISEIANYIYHYTPNSLSVRHHNFYFESQSYYAIKNAYQLLLSKNHIDTDDQIKLLQNNYQVITRPLISIMLIEKCSLKKKNEMILSLDDEYFDILKHYFLTTKKSYLISRFCNKKRWFLLGILLYIRHRLLGRFF